VTNREFRKRIGDILARQKEDRLEAMRAEVRAEKKAPVAETKPLKRKAQGVMTTMRGVEERTVPFGARTCRAASASSPPIVTLNAVGSRSRPTRLRGGLPLKILLLRAADGMQASAATEGRSDHDGAVRRQGAWGETGTDNAVGERESRGGAGRPPRKLSSTQKTQVS